MKEEKFSNESHQHGAELLQKYFDGSLNVREGEELLALLKQSSEFSDSAYRQYETEHEMRLLGRSQSSEMLLPSVSTEDALSYTPSKAEQKLLEEIIQSSMTSQGGDEVVVSSSRRPDRPKSVYRKAETFDAFSKLVFGSAAFLLLIGLGFWLQQENSSKKENLAFFSFHPLATVTAIADPVFSSPDNALKEGQSLGADEIRLESGLVEITMENDIRLVLEGPLDFQIHSLKKTFCRQGKISATVTKTGRGFEIGTPKMSLIDRGTEFVLEVGPESTEAHTIKGRTELVNSVSEKLPLPQGKGVRFTAKQGIVDQIDADLTKFTTRSQVWERQSLFKKKQEEIRDEARDRSSQIPGLRIHYDFSDGNIANLARSEPEESGKPYQVRFDAGRWSGDKAVGFFRDSSKVDFHLDGTFPSMTLIATVKLKSLDRFIHCLLVSRSLERGGIAWQIDGNGFLRFGIRAGESDDAMTRFVSSPCFTPRNYRAWYTVATVVDAESSTIVHYLDGKEIGRERMESPIDAKPGQMILGNGEWNSRTPSKRHLNGWIDDIYLFEKALSPEEIALFCN